MIDKLESLSAIAMGQKIDEIINVLNELEERRESEENKIKEE